jgi:hypothetical protein
MQVGVASVQDTDKFDDQRLGCHSRGVSVNDASAPSLCSLFLAWVCFSVVFSTVFQAILTSFIMFSEYKSPIQNIDELFASGINLPTQINSITFSSKVKKHIYQI